MERAERLRGWAEKRETEAEAAGRRARELSDMIPFGQPILVGHHSEGRHRRDLGRIQSGFTRSYESARMAERHRGRADEIERQAERSVYSDDEDAIEKLEARIAGLEAERDAIKAYNGSCRRGHPDPSLLTDRQREALPNVLRFTPGGPPKDGSMPSYALTNLTGNIARNRKRLAELRGRQT